MPRPADTTSAPDPVRTAEVVLACDDLGPSLAFFVDQLGFRIETIFPADDPQTASLSGHGLRLRLTPEGDSPGHLRLSVNDPGADRPTLAPNGTRIEWVEADPAVSIPPLRPAFIINRRDEGPGAGEGRAGMAYRDLIPDRLGGRYIASHIALAEGGPVADWVHFHQIRFQLIYCRTGWARLVYEDQGPPFVMAAGDCVLQPPGIRHRVLESSPGLEVVEVSCPALHETLADHDMTLPTGRSLPDRLYGGQSFLHHVAADAAWKDLDGLGFEGRDTGVGHASRGIAQARVLRPAASPRMNRPAHADDLLFGFVLEGSAILDFHGEHPLGPCDAFVIPAGESWSLLAKPDLRLLEVRAAAFDA